MPPAPKLQPALFGGLFIGVLSALPIINIGNCCCLWVVSGGVLAAHLMQQNHPRPVAAADGAPVGLLPGFLGGLLGAVLLLPPPVVVGPSPPRFMEAVPC